MNKSQTPPTTFEEWRASLTEEESMRALWERLDALHNHNHKLKTQIKDLTEKLNSLKGLLNTHKHAATTGEATLPAALVNL